MATEQFILAIPSLSYVTKPAANFYLIRPIEPNCDPFGA